MKALRDPDNFLALPRPFSSFKSSRIAILPVPYERTVSYGSGAGKGPRALLRASAYVEFYDDEFDRELCFDTGITTLEPLALEKLGAQASMETIQTAVAELIGAGKFVVTLGGEHTISTPAILAHLAKFPGMSLLHFDAHSDLRDSYEGTKFSHACFAARVAESMDPARITQVGIRAQCREEAEFIWERGIQTFYATAIRRGVHGPAWAKKVVDTLEEDVYVTFDLDYFDPAIMPSTGTPEPDGFHYSETLDLLRYLRLSGRRIVGFDIVELAPIKGLAHPNVTAARLLYKLLNLAFTDTLPTYPAIARWR